LIQGRTQRLRNRYFVGVSSGDGPVQINQKRVGNEKGVNGDGSFLAESHGPTNGLMNDGGIPVRGQEENAGTEL
jgi:hypothetical protein